MPGPLLDLIAVYLGMAAVLCVAARALGKKYQWDRTMLLLLLQGAALRFFYVLGTRYNERAYDADGHLQYVQYVYQNWAIPTAIQGWQFYQPPLYYFLAALWSHAGNVLFSASGAIMHIQGLSFFLSCWTLLIAAAIGSELFPAAKDRVRLELFCCIMVFLPGIVFFASRISNESLFHPLSFLFFWLLLRWWKSGSGRLLALCAFVVAVSILAKTTGAVLFGILLVCVVLRPADKAQAKLRSVLVSCFILIAVAGWLSAKRLFFEANIRRTITFNNAFLNSKLAVPNDARSFLTFNPVQLVAQPFNNSWNSPRRFAFPEFFWRSVFFGEFIFSPFLASVALFLSLLLFPFLLRGLWLEIRSPGPYSDPLLVTALLFFLAFVIYRFAFPFASCQDFRFGILSAVTAAAFLVRGSTGVPKLWKKIAMALLVVSMGVWGILLLLV